MELNNPNIPKSNSDNLSDYWDESVTGYQSYQN